MSNLPFDQPHPVPQHQEEKEPVWTLVDIPGSRLHGMYVYASENDIGEILEGKRDPNISMTGEEALAFLKFTVNTWMQQWEDVAKSRRPEPPEECYER